MHSKRCLSQRTFFLFSLLVSTIQSHADAVFPGYFHLINTATNEVLECKIQSDGNVALTAGGHVKTPNQEWEIFQVGENEYKIFNRLHRLVLNLKSPNLGNGSDIDVSKRNDDFQQNWILENLGENLFLIRSAVSGKCLEIQQSLGVYTDRIQQWNYRAAQGQIWKIQRVPEYFEGVHYIENEFLRVGVDLDCGGAICWISEKDSDRNVVNTKDLGRYIQQSYYAGNSINRQQEGQIHFWSPFPWNPIQAGDYFGNRSLVMDLKIEENSIYTKTRPLLWDMNLEYANAWIETWIQLDGKEIVYHGKLTRFDWNKRWGMVEHPQELPACYLSSDLKHFYSYTGSDIWNYHLNKIPNARIWENWITHESWVACVDDSLWGFSVYFPGVATFTGGYYVGCDQDDSTAYISPRLNATLGDSDVYEFMLFFNIGPLNEMMHHVYLRRHRNQLIAASLLKE